MVKKNCAMVKSDLSSVMYKHALDKMVAQGGMVSFITTSSWMYLSSFEKLWKWVLNEYSIDSLVDFVKIYKAKGMAWITVEEDGIKSSIAKFLSDDAVKSILAKAEAEAGDIIMFVADKNSVVYDALGALRVECAKRLNLIDKKHFKFLWVTEFPLIE